MPSPGAEYGRICDVKIRFVRAIRRGLGRVIDIVKCQLYWKESSISDGGIGAYAGSHGGTSARGRQCDSINSHNTNKVKYDVPTNLVNSE